MKYPYELFFPFPVKHNGMFAARADLIITNKDNNKNNPNYFFTDKLPNIGDIHNYFQLITNNTFDKTYFGELLTQQDSWKLTGACADLDNFYNGLEKIINEDLLRSYFMTNTAGHHANNKKYELFCPINQLFFIVEYLNKAKFFPNILWIDIDAHFGNGDKEIFDSYINKMKNETVNLTGISFQNDYQNIQTDYFKAINYDTKITPDEFINLLSTNITISNETDYVILFFGTDIFSGDYGDNTKLDISVLPNIITFFEKLVEDKTLIIVQTGGTIGNNIQELINKLSSIKFN